MMEKAEIRDGMLCYRKWMRQYAIPVSDIVWAYIQQEDTKAAMCCGSFSIPIGRVIIYDCQGRKEIFQYEGMEEPKKLLASLEAANPQMAVGYTKENRLKFGGSKQV